MDLSINGKHVDVGDALRAHVEEMLNGAVSKYFDRPLDGTVTFSREGVNFRVDISVHAARGVSMQGSAMAADAYTAFDGTVEKIAKRLRRRKRRMRDRHKGGGRAEAPVAAPEPVFAPDDEDQEQPVSGKPVVIAEPPAEIATLVVSQAVMRMDLEDATALMFRNRAHGGLNVIYRRPDGNIGWIDPGGEPSAGN